MPEPCISGKHIPAWIPVPALPVWSAGYGAQPSITKLPMQIDLTYRELEVLYAVLDRLQNRDGKRTVADFHFLPDGDLAFDSVLKKLETTFDQVEWGDDYQGDETPDAVEIVSRTPVIREP